MTGDRPSLDAGMIGRGFTLVELLLVVAIIATLAGILTPMLGMAQRSANATATRAVMAKVDGALRRFQTDLWVFPFQRTYADLDAGAGPDNRLFYHLGTDLSAANRNRIRQDMDAVAALYVNEINRGNTSLDAPASVHAIRISDVVTEAYYWGDYQHRQAGMNLINRLAKERQRLRLVAGDVDAKGERFPVGKDAQGLVIANPRDNTGTALLASPASKDKPGWAADYLAGDLEPRFVRGEAILDGWGMPLVYVCQVVPGAKTGKTYMYRQNAYLWNPAQWGLEQRGRKAVHPIPGNHAIVADNDPAGGLPDNTRPLHSDRRRYAGTGYEFRFELVSLGADGRGSWWRDDPANRDAILFEPYDRELP